MTDPIERAATAVLLDRHVAVPVEPADRPAELRLIECLEGTAYMVDTAGRICSYGRRNWNAFANDNDAPELCEPGNVIGVDLLDVVQGDEVRDIYRCLMQELLDAKKSSFCFAFRCDAPDFLRHMRMAITPVAVEGAVTGILFHSIVLRIDMRPPLDIFRFRNHTAETKRLANRPLIKVCSYCQNIKGDRGDRAGGPWMSAETYYQGGGSSEVQISHGVCETCFAEITGR